MKKDLLQGRLGLGDWRADVEVYEEEEETGKERTRYTQERRLR